MLAKSNSRLSFAIRLAPGEQPKENLLIATERTDANRRKAPAKIVVSYCPFCGEKL